MLNHHRPPPLPLPPLLFLLPLLRVPALCVLFLLLLYSILLVLFFPNAICIRVRGLFRCSVLLPTFYYTSTTVPCKIPLLQVLFMESVLIIVLCNLQPLQNTIPSISPPAWTPFPGTSVAQWKQKKMMCWELLGGQFAKRYIALVLLWGHWNNGGGNVHDAMIWFPLI